MTRTEGKVHAEVVEKLKAEGVEGHNVAVAALGRGTDRLVLLDGEVIGEYNHRSKRLYLYQGGIHPEG